jgi:hypothetical protein
LSGILCAVNDDPILFNLGDELCEILVEMSDDLGPHGMCALAARLPIGQGREGGDASLDAALGVIIQGDLQGFIGNGLTNAFFK